MHVIVVGCGRVGSELATTLDKAGHSVSIIDKSRNAFRRLPERWSGRAVVGYGYDRDHLEQAGIREAGALAAVTSGDNSNIISARIARETYEIPNVVARIYDPRRAAIYQRLGIPTVATVTWTTDQVVRRLFPEESVSEWVDPTASVSLIERALPPAWAGQRLLGLFEGGPNSGASLVSVTRSGQARLASPDIVGQEGDILHVAVLTTAREAFEARLSAGHEGGHH